MTILDGKKLARNIRHTIKQKVEELLSKPCLAVIIVGNDPGSQIYVNMKVKACEEVGFISKKNRT
jgi:methylenetetrahydrofolate dehydrogenase (NADP+)/methenyltetrahydrofolate cyclohydrolase